MPSYRTAYTYYFKLGNKIVHCGITNNLWRRQNEHRQTPGWEKGHIKRVGYYRITRADALAWEREQGKLGKPVRDPIPDV